MKYSTRKRYLKPLKFWRGSWFGIIIVGIVCFWACTFFVISNWGSSNEIGDSFGMVNALFSGLAFSFLVYTAWMQRHELMLQRLELKQTRKEMAQATEAHQKHVKLVELQIKNEERKHLAEFKPDLRTSLTMIPNFDEENNYFSFATPLNDCFVTEIIFVNPDGYAFSQDFNLIIERRIGDKGVLQRLNLPDASAEFKIAVNYSDLRHNKYHQKYKLVAKPELKLEKRSTELLGHAFYNPNQEGDSSDFEVFR